MEIYQRSPVNIVKITIAKRGLPSEHFTVWKCTMEEAYAHFQKVISREKLSDADKLVTSIQVRETVDGKNGRALSLSCKGLTPKQTKDILIKSIK
jgi:hypothetical protein